MNTEEGHSIEIHPCSPKAVLSLGTPGPQFRLLLQWTHSSWVGGGKEPRAGAKHRTGVTVASVSILGQNG